MHTPLDFSQTALATDYPNFYAQILDNVFTPAECASLISQAEASAKDGWEPARLGSHTVNNTFRDSERILHTSPETAAFIFERVKPYLEVADIQRIDIPATGRWPALAWSKSAKIPQGKIGHWQLKGLNELLRFLKYSEGHFFRPHVDGMFPPKLAATGPVEKSFLTLHLYLNGDGEGGGPDGGPDGGATRFWSKDKAHWIDVEPKVGRVLLFQQRLLMHSGEEVRGGTKYTMRTDVMYDLITENEPRRTPKKR